MGIVGNFGIVVGGVGIVGMGLFGIGVGIVGDVGIGGVGFDCVGSIVGCSVPASCFCHHRRRCRRG